MSRDLTLLHPKLQALIPKIIAECAAQGLPVLITDGMRSKEEQDELYAQGRTKPGQIVTSVRYPNSMHNWGVAFDFCRNVKDREYDDTDNFFYRVAFVAKQYGLAWGGDWRSFKDKPHLQLAEYSADGTTAYLQGLYRTPEAFIATWKPAETVAGFTDVPADAWYREALEWAVPAGIAAGFEDGTFRPDLCPTRAQLISVEYRHNALLDPRIGKLEARVAQFEQTLADLIKENGDDHKLT